MQIKVKREDERAVIPKYSTQGAACFDIVAIDDGSPHPKDYHAAIYETGLSFEVPTGFVMLIFSRSGHGFNQATRLSNCVGVIDSDYRGTVKVSLRLDASGDHRCAKLRAGDRIAQAMILPLPVIELVEAGELSETARGDGGFGHTG